MFTEGSKIVTVSRDGARLASGRYPVWITAVYQAVRRSDGVLTWKRVDSVGYSTSGYRVTSPMIHRAVAYARLHGLEYVPHVRAGMLVEYTSKQFSSI